MRKLGRFGMLLFLCVAGVVVMKVLAFDGRSKSADTGKGEETIVGWMIRRIADGEIELSDEESIRRALAEGEEKFDIALTAEDEDRIVGFTQTLDTVEAGADDLIGQAGEMYEKYCAEFVEQANDTINGALQNAAEDAAQSFFQSIIPKKDE